MEKSGVRYTIDSIFEFILLFSAVIPWICGVVLANGYLKIFASLFPPYAWYLFVEKIMAISGFI